MPRGHPSDSFSNVFGTTPSYGEGVPHKHGFHHGYHRARYVDRHREAREHQPQTHVVFADHHRHVTGHGHRELVVSPSRRHTGDWERSEKYYHSGLEEEPLAHSYGERKVKKLVQVPVTHEIKVPVCTEKVVHRTEVKEIPTRELVQEEAVKTVEEEYVEYEEREAVRMKERWVRQEVPETYIERVPVTKTRLVEVPYTVTKEVTGVKRVEVPVHEVVEERGYRVDEVTEVETHEVEGVQRVEWVPRVVDEWANERDVGVRDKYVVDRRMGKTIYPEGTAHLKGLAKADTEYYTEDKVVDRKIGTRFYPEDEAVVHSSRSFITDSISSKLVAHGDSHFGVYLKETVVGLVVKDVVPGSSGADAGIMIGDIVNKVDDLEVYSLDDWRRAIGRKSAVTISYRSKQLGRNFRKTVTH